jgi:hypothetical protein
VNHAGAALSSMLKQHLENALETSRQQFQSFSGTLRNLQEWESESHPLVRMWKPSRDAPLPASISASASFPHALNNMQVAGEYAGKILDECRSHFAEHFPSEEKNAAMFEHCLDTAFATLKNDLAEAHTQGCRTALAMIKVHLRPMFKPLDDLSFVLSQAEYAEAEVNDPFVRNFLAQTEVLHAFLVAVFTPESTNSMMRLLVEQVCTRIETTVRAKDFTMLGAVKLDHDVRAIQAYFTERGAPRAAFSRLSDLGELLAVESRAELRELEQVGKKWSFEPEDLASILAQRTDLED